MLYLFSVQLSSMKTWFRVTLYRYGARNKECIEDKEDNSVLQSYFLYLLYLPFILTLNGYKMFI